MKKYKRTDGFSEVNLVHSAIDHLTSAKILFKEGPPCFDSAGYLCHIGIELILKAILLNKTDEFDNEHSLVGLSNQIRAQKVELNYSTDQNRTLEKVNSFYDLRYPKEKDPIEIGSDDWDQIENLYEFLIFTLPNDIQEQIQNIDRGIKGGRIVLKKKQK